MTHEDYQRIANHWKVRDAESIKMERELLLAAVEKYIMENDTCALATGTDSFIRCTPIEYTYHEEAFWMFTEGGEKFIALEQNKHVCLAIFDKYVGFSKLKGMQVTGIAEIIEPFCDEYIMAAEYRKIPLETLKKLPEKLNLICVRPTRIEFLNSEFKNQGYDSRQSIEIVR